MIKSTFLSERNMLGSSKSASTHGRGSNTRNVNVFRSYIRGEYNQVFSKFLREAKSIKMYRKILKDDRKWLKKLHKGGMSRGSQCKQLEEYFIVSFSNENHPICSFMKEFVRFVRKNIYDLVDSLFANPKRLIKDYSLSTEFIVDAILNNYERILPGILPEKYPLDSMKSMINTYISVNNGKDMIFLLEKFFCDDEKHKNFLKIREFLFLERLNFSRKELILPKVSIPYLKPIMRLRKISTTYIIEQQMKIIEECYDSIFEVLDKNRIKEPIDSVDLSLIIAYILMNADIYKTPAWIEYIKIFSNSLVIEGIDKTICNLFIKVMNWLINEIDITYEWEIKKQEENSKKLEILSQSLRKKQNIWVREKKKEYIVEKNQELREHLEEKKKKEEEKKKQKEEEEKKKKFKEIERKIKMLKTPKDDTTTKNKKEMFGGSFKKSNSLLDGVAKAAGLKKKTEFGYDENIADSILGIDDSSSSSDDDDDDVYNNNDDEINKVNDVKKKGGVEMFPRSLKKEKETKSYILIQQQYQQQQQQQQQKKKNNERFGVKERNKNKNKKKKLERVKFKKKSDGRIIITLKNEEDKDEVLICKNELFEIIRTMDSNKLIISQFEDFEMDEKIKKLEKSVKMKQVLFDRLKQKVIIQQKEIKELKKKLLSSSSHQKNNTVGSSLSSFEKKNQLKQQHHGRSMSIPLQKLPKPRMLPQTNSSKKKDFSTTSNSAHQRNINKLKKSGIGGNIGVRRKKLPPRLPRKLPPKIPSNRPPRHHQRSTTTNSSKKKIDMI